MMSASGVAWSIVRTRLGGTAVGKNNGEAAHNSTQQHTTAHNNISSVFVMTGRYQTPLTGTYFLDIIAVFCHDFLHDHSMSSGGGLPWENDYDFEKTCTEPSFQRPLTNPGQTLEVVTTIHINHNHVGYWIHKNDQEQKPLGARFQPEGCYRSMAPNCVGSFTNTTPFQAYDFHFAPPNQGLTLATLLDSLKSRNATTSTVVCVVGASHGRKMFEYLIAADDGLIQNDATTRQPLKLVYEDIRMPHQLTPAIIQRLMATKHCTKFVVAIGQWPAGKRFRIHRGQGPTTFAAYYHAMKEGLQSIQQHVPQAQIYARSINYNPIGGMIGACPPTDWRSPIVIDGYNAVLEHLVTHELRRTTNNATTNNQNAMTYVDTNAIVGPMWDAASDWCHLDPFVGLLHALYVLAVALGVWK